MYKRQVLNGDVGEVEFLVVIELIENPAASVADFLIKSRRFDVIDFEFNGIEYNEFVEEKGG